MGIIPITWYIETPIDFEHKQYTLLSYLQRVDASFIEKQLSPHLLHMENMLKELYVFDEKFLSILKDFDRNRYKFFNNPKLEGEDNELVYEVKDIVDFSIPQVKTRLNLGYKILERHSQILF
jgi:hypothetical protein